MPELPTWTILIPTVGQREPLFRRLLSVLLPQVEPHAGRVRVLAWWNNGRPSLGTIRQRLVQAAETDYVSFIDDDDLVPGYHVAEVMQALTSGPDHVGFKLEFSVDGDVREIVDHSIRHPGWGRGKTGLYRDLTHIDPIRTALALRADFQVARAGKAEDRAWVKQVRPHVQTEAYIDRVMYHYLWSPNGSVWRNPGQLETDFVRPDIDHPHFSWHPESPRV